MAKAPFYFLAGPLGIENEADHKRHVLMIPTHD